LKQSLLSYAVATPTKAKEYAELTGAAFHDPENIFTPTTAKQYQGMQAMYPYDPNAANKINSDSRTRSGDLPHDLLLPSALLTGLASSADSSTSNVYLALGRSSSSLSRQQSLSDLVAALDYSLSLSKQSNLFNPTMDDSDSNYQLLTQSNIPGSYTWEPKSPQSY
jgi:hypothetical protein